MATLRRFPHAKRFYVEPLEDRRLLAAFDLLVFSETTGFRHSSIDEGIAAIQSLGLANDFSVTATEDSSVFASASIHDYEAVVFLNTTGTPLNSAEQAGLQDYIRAGGGFVGVHAAADTHKNWDWYVDLVGAAFQNHPAIQSASLLVADQLDPSTAHLNNRNTFADEWYNYDRNPRGEVHVLMTIDESSYSGGSMGYDHPIAWRHHFEGGRSWYTGLGHREPMYNDQRFLDHLLGGIEFAAGQTPQDGGGGVATNFEKTVLETEVNDPMSLEVAPDGTVFFVELDGRVRKIDPVTGVTSTIGVFSVDVGNEDGLLGLALDPNFATNGWMYFFYTPDEAVHVQRIARVTYDGSTLDRATDVTLLEVPSDENCCHTGGSLAFGPNGLLYASLGDDTNPFQSNGFGPIDEQPGREAFDAQRTSANADDLRGKILRIKPEADGSYSIPGGNLFPADGSQGRPEIYVMGSRNPFRIAIDQETGDLYWGDVGPDAGGDDPNRGPRGYDEINRARQAGNFGWPYVIADNQAYNDHDFATNVSGAPFDPDNLVNDSPNNTGPTALPDAEPAFIWYPYANSPDFPEFGSGSRAAMVGGVYQYDASLDSDRKLPEYYDGALFVYDWARGGVWEVRLDDVGEILKINPVFTDQTFTRPIEMEFGPDGAAYLIEWGTGFPGNNADAQIVRVDFTANLPQLVGDYNDDGVVNAADYTVWRDVERFEGDHPADGDNDGYVNDADYDYWRLNYGATVPAPGVAEAPVVVSHEAVDEAFDSPTLAPAIAFAQAPDAAGSQSRGVRPIDSSASLAELLLINDPAPRDEALAASDGESIPYGELAGSEPERFAGWSPFSAEFGRQRR
ncbi:Quinoprotein glucose dehydrogenase B precursor [Planctomycetes bacterium MalM25]|nr:Quinoprotein glucose dehydrogenase B precursor [Planctomycetes bacterium MalM25]